VRPGAGSTMAAVLTQKSVLIGASSVALRRLY
jgi:hypothetical protein